MRRRLSFSGRNKARRDRISGINAKWFNGHGLKWDYWILSSPTNRSTYYAHVEAVPCLGAIKIILPWGDIESRSGGVSTFTWTWVDEVVNAAAAMSPPRKVIFGLIWRNFLPGSQPFDSTLNRLLPNDLLVSTDGTAGSGATLHTVHDYAYMSGTTPTAYNLRLSDSTLMARYKTFIDKLAERYDTNPTVVRIDTQETAYGTPFTSYSTGTNAAHTSLSGNDVSEVTSANQEAGMAESTLYMKSKFPHTPVQFSGNFPRSFVKDFITTNNYLLLNNINLGCPDGNLQNDLNTTGATPGILLYYQDSALIDKVGFCPEVQRDTYESSTGAQAPIVFDYPPYADIFTRYRDTLNATSIMWQADPDFFTRDSANPPAADTRGPCKTFLQTYAGINNGSPSYGLKTTIPSNYL